jgi:hypothetical protein
MLDADAIIILEVIFYVLGLLTVPLIKRRKQIFQFMRRAEEEFEERPKKRKAGAGRPKGSKNKPKEEEQE